jgi:hypothetical protein
MTYKNIYADNTTWDIDSNRNTLIEKTSSNNFNEWEEYTSFEENIFLSIKWKLDEIVSPEQVLWDYTYLSYKKEIKNNWKVDLDNWTEKEEENVKNSIINNARNTLKSLLIKEYKNYPDHIISKVDTIIFAYAMKTWIYSEEEINSINFGHWEDKNYYIEKYWTDNQDELLEKLKELWEDETKSLRKYKKNNPEEKSYLGECSWTCC